MGVKDERTFANVDSNCFERNLPSIAKTHSGKRAGRSEKCVFLLFFYPELLELLSSDVSVLELGCGVG